MWAILCFFVCWCGRSIRASAGYGLKWLPSKGLDPTTLGGQPIAQAVKDGNIMEWACSTIVLCFVEVHVQQIPQGPLSSC